MSVNALGLFECFSRALSCLSLDDGLGKLIGFGCDGTSINMGANALRGRLESDRLVTISQDSFYLVFSS